MSLLSYLLSEAERISFISLAPDCFHFTFSEPQYCVDDTTDLPLHVVASFPGQLDGPSTLCSTPRPFTLPYETSTLPLSSVLSPTIITSELPSSVSYDYGSTTDSSTFLLYFFLFSSGFGFGISLYVFTPLLYQKFKTHFHCPYLV